MKKQKTKQKTKKAAVKRFKLTKTGKLLRRRQNAGHLKTGKSKSQERRAKTSTTLMGRFKSKIIRLITA